MKYRYFQGSGLSVSEIGIGTNRFGHKVDQKEVCSIINECLNLGINNIDTANVVALLRKNAACWTSFSLYNLVNQLNELQYGTLSIYLM